METPLTLDEMKRVVERRGGRIPRVPLFWHKFYNNGTIEKYGEELAGLNASVVDDCISLNYTAPGNFHAPEGAPGEYKWAIEPDPGDLDSRGITSRNVVSSTELVGLKGGEPSETSPWRQVQSTSSRSTFCGVICPSSA